jgi:general secretion pathway protein F
VPTFRYKAYTSQNVITEGMIAADGLEAAIDALYNSGLTPFETSVIWGASAKSSGPGPIAREQSYRPVWKRELLSSNRWSLKELTAFTVELSSLTNSGLPLDEAFRVIAGPGAVPKTIRLASGLLKDILAGSQLSEAMALRPQIFPPDYRAILSAGEVGGEIGKVLKQIAELLTRRLEIRGKILAALVYPAVLVAMSLVSIAVIVIVLIPSIGPIFTDAGLPLPGIFQTFADLQDDWIEVVAVLGAGSLAGFLIWNASKHNHQVRLAVDRIKCVLPVVGNLIQIREAGAFARALGTLLSARVPLMSALQTCRGLVTNRYLAAGYANAIDRIPEGTPLHQAFSEAGLIPAAALRLVAVGEATGQLGSMLAQSATILENDLHRHIERLVALLTPLLTLAVGGSVGALIMEVMKAVLSINDLAFQ